jgi:ABC-type transporter Mla subunit MlaD
VRLTSYSPRASARRSPLANAAIALLTIGVLVGFVLIGIQAPNSIPGRSYYTVTAQLTDAANVGPHTNVRIGGVRVGQVLNPRFAHGHPVIDLQLNQSVAPLLSDTTIRLRPQSAIGEPYVELIPGRTGRPIASGGTLAPGSTAAIGLDRVLATFDQPTRSRFQALMSELGAGTLGTGHALNGAIAAAPGMLSALTSVTDRLASEPAALRGFVSGTASVVTSLAAVRNQLSDLFHPAASLMATVASNRVPLQATLDLAPPTFAAVQVGLQHTDPALEQLSRFATAALPALQLAPNALERANRLLSALRNDVPPLNGTLHLAGQAVSPTLTLLDSARSDTGWLNGALSGAQPLVTELAPRRCDIVRLARNWANMFAFGEPKALGTNLQVAVVTPDFKSLGGNLPLGLDTALPWPKDPYPAPCQSWTEVTQLAQGGK